MLAEVIAAIATALNDVEHVTYTEAQLLQGINRACLATVLVNPSAHARLLKVVLVAGILQTLPEQALRLIDAYYRLDEQGQPIAPITLVERKEFDFLPAPLVDPVQHVAYDPVLPDHFVVDPAASADEQLLLLCSEKPAVVTCVDDPFPLPIQYQEPVIEYVLYLMYSRDAERSPNAQRASVHRQAFFDLLQVKAQADSVASADVRRLANV